MSTSNTDFIKHILGSELSKLLTESVPLVTQFSVMLMMHKVNNNILSESVADIKKNFSKILQIVTENCLQMPEEECEVSTAIKKLTEEGEGAPVAAPTNVTAGIEPTVPRIYTKKKPKDELPE